MQTMDNNGAASPLAVEKFTCVAVIDPEQCIGCSKCLPPCPVDAIIGTAKYMHTVLVAECTGCGLCVAPCPVDCISLQPLAVPLDAGQLQQRVALAERRMAAQASRREKQRAEQQRRAQLKKAALLGKRPVPPQ